MGATSRKLKGAQIAEDPIIVQSLASRGVSLSVMLMAYEIAIKTRTLREDCTTAELANEIVTPLTKNTQTSFVEYLRDKKGWPLKEAEIHVVHSWQMRAVDTLLAIADMANAGGPSPSRKNDLLSIHWHKQNRPENLDRSFFLCPFVVNQHSLARHLPGDPACEIDKFHLVARRVYAVHRRPMLVVLDDTFTPLARTCCLQEIHTAITSRPPMLIRYALSNTKVHCQVDVESSGAHDCGAKVNIMQKIRAMPGGIKKFNKAVRTHVSAATPDSIKFRDGFNAAALHNLAGEAEVLGEILHVALSASFSYTGIAQAGTLRSQVCNAVSHTLADAAETDPGEVRTLIEGGVGSTILNSYVRSGTSRLAHLWFCLCLAEFTGHMQQAIKTCLQEIPGISSLAEDCIANVDIISIRISEKCQPGIFSTVYDESVDSGILQEVTGSRITRSNESSVASAGKRGVSTYLDGTTRNSLSVRELLPVRTDAKITDRFEVDALEFASGGHGKVFKAKDRQFPDLTVVIKKVVCNNEEKRASFRREVNIMKELDHPNICKVLEVYEEGRFMYIVMENCEGGELFSRINDTQEGMAEYAAADIIQQVSSALMFTHKRKIAHRDLKPENICFCSRDLSNCQVKVIDWGLGFHFEYARMKSAVGSLAYAAPEVLDADPDEGRVYTSQCDLWSLGALTYVLLCGRTPFWGTLRQQMNKMKKEEYPMSKAPWNEVSENAKDFIKKLLRYDPSDRLTVDQAVCHPWFSILSTSSAGTQLTAHVVSNLHEFSSNSKFFAICIGAVARQLDHKHLQQIYQVFLKMDANGDGTIDSNEIKRGFQEVYGEGSEEVNTVLETFKELDLDSSGCIDYTEFCAAALGEKILEQENVLWSAFKAFDVHCDDGKITKEEIVQVLQQTDVQRAWSKDVCQQVAQEVVDKFDKLGVGYLDFEAWLDMMKAAAWDQDASPSSQLLPGDQTRCWVAWVSVDPRTSFISCYPGEIATLLEEGLQRGEQYVHLGEKFYGARVCFRGKETGKPFQRTSQGMRDVRRVYLAGEGVAAEEVKLLVKGGAGDYHIEDEVSPNAVARRVMVNPENAVNSEPIRAAIKAPKPQLEAWGVSWWQNSAFTADLQGAASPWKTLRCWLQGVGTAPCMEGPSARGLVEVTSL